MEPARLDVPEWWKSAALRKLFGPDGEGATVMAHATGPERQAPRFAFLALEATPRYAEIARTVHRSVVVIEGGVSVSFDWVAAADPGARWAMTGTAGRRLLQPEGSEGAFLHVSGASTAAGGGAERVEGVDLEGVRTGEWLVLFHTGATSATSPVSFLTRGAERLRILVTGLSPGVWEVWRDGWVTEPQAVVGRTDFCLYFDGQGGDYFIRRLN